MTEDEKEVNKKPANLRRRRSVENNRIANSIFGTADFTYGLANSGTRQSDLLDIEIQLENLELEIENTFNILENLMAQQQWLESTALYANAIQRVTYLLQELNDEFTLHSNGQLQPESSARTWAAEVISFGSDGIAQALFNLHDMMMGSTHLFWPGTVTSHFYSHT